jgi:hypothetical protein
VALGKTGDLGQDRENDLLLEMIVDAGHNPPQTLLIVDPFAEVVHENRLPPPARQARNSLLGRTPE